jgi:GTP-binding protein
VAGLDDLSQVVRKPLWKAADGTPGAGGRKEGRAGADLVIEVPVGTTVFDDESGDLIVDLERPGASATVAGGGVGGDGNVRRATSVNRAPGSAGPGAPGDERAIRLELSMPVDIALLGPPNSGKSALLAALTNARPRVAEYPHTTTRPEPGVIFDAHGAPLVLLEIPARDRSLRQLSRARAVALVHDGRVAPDPALRQAAGDRPVLDVRTHSDEVRPADRLRGPIWVSTVTGEGLDKLRNRLLTLARSAPPRPPREPPVRVRLRARRAAVPEVSIQRRAWGFEVSGPGLERLLDRYDLASADGFDRFQLALDRAGVTAALDGAGAEPGDTVRIGDSEFEYQP